ncbi:uncharacterized protein LOC106669950 [Cimex lectularius]|uniref:WD repeat-containing protein 55 homolog n=1 Tax=Cimex lectularius TaxID=79782 RepID=A0A8I6S3I8_CIMLE|nr:uncharacterized protein LOC106669950 [Cimex lectularius]
MEKILLRLEERRAIYESLKDRAKKIKEKQKVGLPQGISDFNVGGYHQVLEDDTSEEEFVPETAHFRPEYSDEQKDIFMEVRGKVDVSMENRRQVWLPRDFCEDYFEDRLSYFSEKAAQIQNIKTKLMSQFYLPHAGKYRVSGGLFLDRFYEPHTMLGVSCLAMTSDVGYIARGHGNGIVKIWNVGADTQVTMEPYEDCSRITRIKFIEQPETASLFAVSRAGNIYYCSQNVKGWECDLFTTEKDNEIEALDIGHRNKRIITAGSDATIRIYNVDTRKIEKSYDSYKHSIINQYLKSFKAKLLEDEGHYLRLYAVKFMDENSNVFFTGGLDGTVKVWDLRTALAVENLVGPLICGDTIDCYGNKLLCGQWTSEDSLLCYDIRTFRPMRISPTNRVLGSRGEYPYCCKFLRDYEHTFVRGIDGDLVMCGGCRSLEIISLSEKVVVWALPDDGNVVSVDNSFPFIAHASSAHQFTVSTFSPSIRLFKSLLEYEEFDEELEDVKEEFQEEQEEEGMEVEAELEEEVATYKLMEDLEGKPEDATMVLNDIIMKYATRDFATQGDLFVTVWKLARKRLLRDWIKNKNDYEVLRQQANAQKEVLHSRKHRWCEKNIILRKTKEGEVRIPLKKGNKSVTLEAEVFSTKPGASSQKD